MIRLTIPSIEQEDLEAVREVVASGYLVQAGRVEEFERAVAAYVGTAHAVAVANCTAALHLSLLALDIRPGDRVAVPTYSWPATANVVALCGAEPVFIDISPDTYGMDPGALEDALRRKAVKAILPVHAFGGMADVNAIRQIAARAGVPVIEDAACALGAALSGANAGTWGVAGCFSFHPRKAVTTGEGGMVTTNDANLARRLRILRNHGLDPAASAPDFVAPGYNLRLTEFQAALGSTQMAKIERIIASRRAGAERYDELLRHTGMTAPRALAGSRHVYQSYVALLPRHAAPRRAEIIAGLKADGIETAIGTYHIPLTTYFRSAGGFRPGDFSVTDDVASRAITLPLYEALTAEDQVRVVSALKKRAGEGD
jgi:dTDP-4-amino-4,6-dideoxygalactose transaminase